MCRDAQSQKVQSQTITSNHGKEWLFSSPIDVIDVKLRNNDMTYRESTHGIPLTASENLPFQVGLLASVHPSAFSTVHYWCFLLIRVMFFTLWSKITFMCQWCCRRMLLFVIGSIEPILEAQHKHSAAGAQLWRNERSCHFLFVGRISLYSVIKGECTMQHWANAESTEEDAFSFKCLLESIWELRLPVQPHLIMKESLLIISSHSVKEGGT